jgi:hypothetical protein
LRIDSSMKEHAEVSSSWSEMKYNGRCLFKSSKKKAARSRSTFSMTECPSWSFGHNCSNSFWHYIPMIYLLPRSEKERPWLDISVCGSCFIHVILWRGESKSLSEFDWNRPNTAKTKSKGAERDSCSAIKLHIIYCLWEKYRN